VPFSPNSVKDLGIPVILRTLPCNGFALKPKKIKITTYILIRVIDLDNLQV
jgi:hypothetical protein